MKWLVVVSLVVISIVASVACSSGPNTTNPIATTTTTTTMPSATNTPPAGVPFGQLADASKAVFVAKCSPCHGNNGQGTTAPAVIGSGANLAKYNTAQGLLSFISANMPFNAPGSLAHQGYLQVLAYLLLQNNYVNQSTILVNEGQLGVIALK